MGNTATLINGIKESYKKNESFANFVVKCFVLFFVYLCIFNSVYTESPISILSNMFFVVIFSLVFSGISVYSSNKIRLLLLFVAVIISLSNSMSLAFSTGLILILFYFLFGSISENSALIVLTTIISFYLRVPFIIPVYFAIKNRNSLAFSSVIGVVSFFIIKSANNCLLAINDVFSKSSPLDEFLLGVDYILKYTVFNSTFIFTVIAFLVSILLSKIIISNGTDFGREIAMISSGVLIIILAFFDNFVFSGSGLFLQMLSVLLSMAIVYLLSVFECTFDYKKAEKVFFQDENNIYYVKIVPKVK